MKAEDIVRLNIKIRGYVVHLFEEFQTPQLAYHNLNHTETVVMRAREIAANYELTNEERFTLHAAAWFHDTGQLLSEQQGHEEVSVQLMNEFFQLHGDLPEETIMGIECCILATKIPTHPNSLLEQMICDADSYHFGTGEFYETNKLVKQETALRGGNVANWDEATRKLLANHKFYTAYCQRKLDAGKARNIQWLSGDR